MKKEIKKDSSLEDEEFERLISGWAWCEVCRRECSGNICAECKSAEECYDD